MSDIEKSFAFLHENAPLWSKNLEEIEKKIAHMQNELAKVPASTSSPLKRKKTGSIESIRDLDAILQEPSNTVDAYQPRYRSRNMMIVVHYDGQIQKQFETLVRSIGTGRNLLRKGKMAARAQALADLASSDDDESDEDAEVDSITAKIQFRRRTGLSSMRAPPTLRSARGRTQNSNATPESLFDTVDKALEHAQALCERAAHQSLREGDCRKELSGMQTFFEEVLEIAAKEVAKHNLRKEQEAAKKVEVETEPEVPSPGQTSMPTPIPQSTPIRMEVKRPIPVIRPIPTAPISLDMGIEIDDDDDNDMDFVMPPVRLTSRV